MKITCPECKQEFEAAAPNQVYDTVRCQKRAERRRRQNRGRAGARFSADEIAKAKLREWEDEQQKIATGQMEEIDPIQDAIDNATKGD